MEEGYGRGFGGDYARFLGYAIGSARETQGWYFRARYLLAEDMVAHRLALLDEVIALLVTTIKQQKRKSSELRIANSELAIERSATL